MALNQFPRRSFVGSSTLQTFTGNGTQTAYTLSSTQTQNECFVFVDDVAQVPGTDFTVSGTTLTFTSAPANTAEIIIRGFGVPAPVTTVSDGSVTAAKLATGAIESKLGYTPVSPTQLSTEVANLVASAPSTLNTLNELAAALGNDANYATTITTALGTKADQATTYTKTEVNNSLALKVGIDSSTGAANLPSGTTAQRPASPVNGMIRYNTSIALNEIYQNGVWNSFAFTYNVEFLIVAGGGGGGSTYHGGGGGAGGLIDSSLTVTSGTSFAVAVGAGGNGGAQGLPGAIGSNGSNSTVFSATAIGGGGGNSYGTTTTGASGGSGGGGAQVNTYANQYLGGSGTSGQGNSGGNTLSSGSWLGGGGGGGAGAAGGNGSGNGSPSGSVGGSGGVGINWKSLGTYYAGGGGGSFGTGGTGGAGGAGGGGNGTTTQGSNGTSNTGGGGGGAERNHPSTTPYQGGNGGSGIVIARYAGSQRATGGTITSSGGYTYHTFTSSGTFTA